MSKDTIRRLVRAAQAVCQSVDGSDPAATQRQHTADLRELKAALAEYYQPKTGERCACRPGAHRDNCPNCEGTGWRIDFAAIRARK